MLKNNNKIVYFYGTTTPKSKKDKSKRVCVAGVLNDKTQSILIGVAQCSNKDSFVKAKGRAIASGRACSSNPYDVIEMPADKPINRFIEEAKTIVNSL